MKVIKGYWSDKIQEEKSEFEIKNHIKNNTIKNVFVGYKEIKNFKISIDQNNRFLLRYALRKNASLKYYCNLLAQSVAVNNETMVFLWDDNYLDFKNRTVNETTLNLLGCK